MLKLGKIYRWIFKRFDDTPKTTEEIRTLVREGVREITKEEVQAAVQQALNQIGTRSKTVFRVREDA